MLLSVMWEGKGGNAGRIKLFSGSQISVRLRNQNRSAPVAGSLKVEGPPQKEKKKEHE